MAAKRRLPMVQTSAEPDTPARPPWQWSLFGAGLLTVTWALLALLVTPLATRFMMHTVGAASLDEVAARLDAAAPETLARIATVNVVLHLGALGLAAFVAGAVTGKWSPGRSVGEAAWAGGVVGVVAIIAAALTGIGRDGLMAILLVIPWTSGFAALGASVGGRKKGVLVGP